MLLSVQPMFDELVTVLIHLELLDHADWVFSAVEALTLNLKLMLHSSRIHQTSKAQHLNPKEKRKKKEINLSTEFLRSFFKMNSKALRLLNPLQISLAKKNDRSTLFPRINWNCFIIREIFNSTKFDFDFDFIFSLLESGIQILVMGMNAERVPRRPGCVISNCNRRLSWRCTSWLLIT